MRPMLHARSARWLLLAFVACIQPERDINNDHVVGVVSIPPVDVEETQDVANNQPESAVALSVAWQTVLLSGTTRTFEDVDWFDVSSRADVVDRPWIVEVVGDGTLRFELRDIDNPTALGPALVATVETSGRAELVFPLGEVAVSDSGFPAEPLPVQEAGHHYALVVSGVDGDDVAWKVTLPSPHAELSGMLVGAFPNADPNDRGAVLGGSDVIGWTGGTEADGWEWRGEFDMYLLRALEIDEEGIVTDADEDPKEAWIFAGTWANLNQGLPAGTLYSSEPQLVVFDREASTAFVGDALTFELAEPLVADTIAPLVIGLDTVEAEPNDLAIDATSYTSVPPGDATDLGVLSGVGFVDRFTGSITFTTGEGYGPHDFDAWAVEVPADEAMLITMDWDVDSADIDVWVFDESGAILDGAASVSKPEVGGGAAVLSPGRTYYVVVAGYSGPENGSTAYELLLEHATP